MRTLPGLNAELAAAIRRVGAAYNRCPPAVRPEVNSDHWRQLEAEIDAAAARGDRDTALVAIEQWEHVAMAELGRAVDQVTPRPFAGVDRG